MAETEIFDAVVVGTGQGGKPLAGDLAESGRRTAVVERDRVGGTCVVRGCTPTKTMVASARVAHLAGRGPEYGVKTGSVSVDMETVRRRKRDIVDDFVEGSRKGLEQHDILELIPGEASFVGPRELAVESDGGRRPLRGEQVFINTGARPLVPPIPGLEDTPYLDSTSVMELAGVPDHLLVLGGSFIGLEFGQMYHRFGADVTVVERSDRLVSREDPDVSEAVEEFLVDEGLRVRTGAEATAVEGSEGSITVRIEEGGRTSELEGSHLLVAVGRTPNTDVLDPEAAGVETDDRGHVRVNERLETTAEGVWALGDVTGGAPFTHTSYDDYRVLRDNLLGDGGRTTEDRQVPYVMYTDPELGRVGLTEEEARERGHDVRVAKLPMSGVARALEMDETRGFMKAVVDGDDDRILGAAILGVMGGEVMSVIETAMMGDLPWTALRDATYAHPTLSESLNNLFMTLE